MGALASTTATERFTSDFGPGFDVTNLRKMRQFYRMFEIRDAARLGSGKAWNRTQRGPNWQFAEC
ncbi:MAG TPA: hypothetical protein VH988_27615 [Thermoanaerobaculia bacterium]|nr:hypothetical protein [Thermoanaerobaculia bacterium]